MLFALWEITYGIVNCRLLSTAQFMYMKCILYIVWLVIFHLVHIYTGAQIVRFFFSVWLLAKQLSIICKCRFLILFVIRNQVYFLNNRTNLNSETSSCQFTAWLPQILKKMFIIILYKHKSVSENVGLEICY